MTSNSIYLSDLVGATIVKIGTIRDDDDGDDMIYFYLDNGVTIGADRPNLWALTRTPFTDVFVDFTDFLEQDSPQDEEDWHDRRGNFLLLADLHGHHVQQVSTSMVDGVRWVFLTLADDCTLSVPYKQLVADGEFDEVWPDAPALEVPEGTAHGEYSAINKS